MKSAMLLFPLGLMMQSDTPKNWASTVPDLLKEGFSKLNAGASQAAVLPDQTQYRNFNEDKTRLSAVTRALSKPLEMPAMSMEWLEDAESNKSSVESMLRALVHATGQDMPAKSEVPDPSGSEDDDVLIQAFADLEIEAGRLPNDEFRLALTQKISSLPKVIRRPMGELIAAMGVAAKLLHDSQLLLEEVDKEFFLTQGIGLNHPDNPETIESISKTAKLYRDKFPAVEMQNAALKIAAAVDRLAVAASTKMVIKTSAILFEQDTPLGLVLVGGKDKNSYDKDAALVLDFGGDDVYTNNAGGGKYVPGRMAVLLDIAGNDKYESKKDYVQGSGAMGLGILLDLDGNDSYLAAHYSQGSGIFGVGMLVDRAGNDRYEAGGVVQGAGTFGFGLLEDESGADEYKATYGAQGFAAASGVGALLDRKGNDKYFAGGKYPDTARDKTKFLSMSQGFSYGNRLGRADSRGFMLTGSVPGGVGILSDLGGDDVYECGIFGQGSAYWFALGMLIDAGGNDSYKSWRYSQGAGTHLAAGILADLGGNDNYSAWGVSQGCAHDFSAAMLVDYAGNDIYKAESLSQGVSNARGSFGLLLDRAGDDQYHYTGKDKNCWGAVGTGEFKAEDMPKSFGFLIDLAGKDLFKGPRTMKDNSDLLDENFGLGVVTDK